MADLMGPWQLDNIGRRRLGPLMNMPGADDLPGTMVGPVAAFEQPSGISGLLLELTGIPQVERTYKAGREAYRDPSISNVTDAGVQSALTIGRPFTAMGLLSAGMGAAVANDAGLLGPANAQQAKGKKPQEVAVPDLPGLSPEENVRYKDLAGKMARGEFGSSAERRMIEDEAKGYRDRSNALQMGELTATQSAKSERARNEEAQRAEEAKRAGAENAAMRDRARQAYQSGLDTQRRFSDTESGKMFDKFGPVAPGAVAAATGAITGAGLRGSGITSARALYGLPAALGTFVGGASAHWPMAYESNYAPVINPSYQAAMNYIREAPPGDPRAAQLKGLIDNGTLEKDNPVRSRASEELYDGKKAAERTALGVLEGGPAGLAGSEAWPALKYLIKGAPKAAYEVGKVPGSALGGLTESTVDAIGKGRSQWARSRTEALGAHADYMAAAEEANAALAAKRAKEAEKLQKAGTKGPDPVTPPPGIVEVQPIPAVDRPMTAAERAKRYLHSY